MSQENVELVRRSYDALQAGDLETVPLRWVRASDLA
jgi:ketosteroid isomerase-like protein